MNTSLKMKRPFTLVFMVPLILLIFFIKSSVSATTYTTHAVQTVQRQSEEASITTLKARSGEEIVESKDNGLWPFLMRAGVSLHKILTAYLTSNFLGMAIQIPHLLWLIITYLMEKTNL